MLVRGAREHTEALREEVSSVLEPMGLRLSPAKTHITRMEEGFDFLGFHIQWRRKRGTNDKWHVYTFIAKRPFQAIKDKIRALTFSGSQRALGPTLIRLNQILRGWTNYFKHAVAKHTFSYLRAFLWRRIVHWQQRQHRWNWTDVRRWLTNPATGRWNPIQADGITLFDPGAVTVTRYRYRANSIPNPYRSRTT